MTPTLLNGLRRQRETENTPSLTKYPFSLDTHYKQLKMICDLNEVIVFHWGALSLCSQKRPDRSGSLDNLASGLASRYKQLGKMDDLNEAIVLRREVLSLCPQGHANRFLSLKNLANDLSSRYEHLGEMDDLNEAIVFRWEALSLCPQGHPSRSLFLNHLANDLSSRYLWLGGMDDLNEAIVLRREVLLLCPQGNANHSFSLNNLANDLSSRYQHLGGMDDLNEAIDLHREALSLWPRGHANRSLSLNNLANDLSSRYQHLGGMNDLNEAIDLHREALSLCPQGNLNRSMYLNNLANDLSSRYHHLGAMDDLNEASVLHLEALLLCSQRHLNRSIYLNNLANDLSSRYRQLGGMDDLNEAIGLNREALLLRPRGHPNRPMSLNNLASSLSSRYEHRKEIGDLNEAIGLAWEALSLCPQGHPGCSSSLNNLANCLFSRYRQLGEMDDLDMAIVLSEDALLLSPPGYPSRSSSLLNLASSYYTRFARLCQAEDKQALFDLCAELVHVQEMVSISDLVAAKAWVDAAEEFNHDSTLLAHETALRLLVEHTAALPPLPQHLTLLKSLSSSLAVDAFSACLRSQSTTKAVELLEQGRAVFWSQLTRLQSPLDDVLASGPKGKILAEEYQRLASLIRNVLHSPDAAQHDRISGLNLKLKKVVSQIRELPGLSRFLLPSFFSHLQRAASDGPVIIMNSSKYGCDALIVFVDKDPVHIPLSITREYVQELSFKLRDLMELAKWEDRTKDFMCFLRELWEKVVSHIVEFLQTTCLPNSRIWWCPTAEFSLLPLHAASPFRKGQKGVSDIYDSSYTTTLAALIHARRASPPDPAEKKKRILAIGQVAAKDARELLNVGTELTNIGRLVDGHATFTRIEGEDACIPNVVNELGKNDWVHFACHGIQNQQRPFESAFALHDDRFTIQHIIQCNLENSEFAYLSACHTTVGDQESPDEVIHLASAMQFAGFRSIIGTTWSVDDSAAREIASKFYELMVDDSGHLDWNRAAGALRRTMKRVNVPIDQRILYVHIGA